MILNRYTWSRISLLFLVITALLGLIIRLLPFQTIIDNSYFYGLLQSHSHTGFLGWVFIAIYILILFKFSENDIFNKTKTKLILSILAFLIGGMTFSFPLFGYNFISISFLSLFLAFSYYALFYLYKNIKNELRETISFKYIKYGIYLYLLSSISPWLLAPIMALGYKKTALYYNDIFFYLHFLYNGFVVFSTIGLFFLNTELRHIKNNSIINNLRVSFSYFFIGTILNYSGSVLWVKPHISIYIIAFISSVLLLIGLYKLWLVYKEVEFRYSKTYLFILNFSLIMFSIKIGLQVLQSIPIFAEVSYILKSQLIIGYIHLVTLGYITLFIISSFVKNKFIIESKQYKIGIYSFIIGFILTELILFGQGVSLWFGITLIGSNFNILMLFSSTFLFIGLCFIFLASNKK